MANNNYNNGNKKGGFLPVVIILMVVAVLYQQVQNGDHKGSLAKIFPRPTIGSVVAAGKAPTQIINIAKVSNPTVSWLSRESQDTPPYEDIIVYAKR